VARHLLEEAHRVDDLEVVGAEGAHPHHTEVGVAHHHRVGGAPLVAGEDAGGDVIDIRLERGLELVLPAQQVRQDRNVLGLERVAARPQGVRELAHVDELGHLALAHDQLRFVLDLLVVVREAVGQRVARVIDPLDDVDELPVDEVHDGHAALLLW